MWHVADFVDSTDSSWQATLDINLRACLVGTRLAAQIMKSQKAHGQGAGEYPWLLYEAY